MSRWKKQNKNLPTRKKLFVNLQLYEGDPLPLRQRHNITYVANTILFQIHFSLEITFETLRRFCFKKIEFVKHEIEI